MPPPRRRPNKSGAKGKRKPAPASTTPTDSASSTAVDNALAADIEWCLTQLACGFKLKGGKKSRGRKGEREREETPIIGRYLSLCVCVLRSFKAPHVKAAMITCVRCLIMCERACIVSSCVSPPLLFFIAGQEPSKVRRVLMSESTTVVQKRAIMRLAYGDYHEQMRRDPEPRHPEGTTVLG